MKLKQSLVLMIFQVTLIFSTNNVLAQITADAEFRFNPVYSRGFRQPLYEGDKPGYFTMQRTRFIVNYNAPEDLKVEVVVQDRRFWGDQNERADVPNMAIFRAWAEKFFTPNLSLKLGRQGLIYDDQYLFGELNWGGTLAHDVALLKYESEAGKIHLGAAYNANRGELKREHYEYNMPKAMQFLWLHKELGALKSSIMMVNYGFETADTVVHFSQTIGTNTSYKVSKALTLKGIYYFQTGEDINSLDLSSYLLSAQALVKVSDNLSFNLGADISSGTAQSKLAEPENTVSNTFERHFGLLHAQFGLLDLFFVKPTNQGIKDFYIKSKIKADALSITNDVHAFASDKTLLHTTTGEEMDDFLGVENDLKISYKFTSTFKATLGHSIMFGTNSLDQLFGGTPIKDCQYIYAVITAKPRLFESKN